MTHASFFYDTKTIIVNLLKKDNKTFLSVGRLQDLLDFIYLQLQEKNKLDEYQIVFDVYFDALERTVIYNGNIFALDIDDKTIYLTDLTEFNSATSNCVLDDTLDSIVTDFVDQTPVMEVI